MIMFNLLNHFMKNNSNHGYIFEVDLEYLLNIFHLVEKTVRFHVDCRPQIRIVYLLHFSQTCEF